MQLEEVIGRVDALYPNPYPREQKLRWCRDVSEGLRQTVGRLYAEADYVWDGALTLPPGVSFSDVEAVFVDGTRVEKVDERTFRDGSIRDGAPVRIVYLLHPDDCILQLSGTITTVDGDAGAVTLPDGADAGALLLQPDEAATLAYGGAVYDVTIAGVAEADGAVTVTVAGSGLPAATDADAVLQSDCHTLYIDYVCAQIAFYQNDLYDYNKFVTAYNEKRKGYANAYKRTNPLAQHKSFRNVW